MPPIAKLWSNTMHRWRNKTAAKTLRPQPRAAIAVEKAVPPGEPPEADLRSGHSLAADSLSRRLSADVGLAADHVESIRTLLEVSQAHQQAIPRAAFQNLELVSKHLRSLQRELDAGHAAQQERPSFRSREDSPARHEALRPRLQRLAFECHASPFDR